MLNYVWLALLMLGIGAAVFTDIYEKSENKYRNDDPLPVVLMMGEKPDLTKEGSYKAEMKVDGSKFSTFYNEKNVEDFTQEVRITVNPKKEKVLLFFKVNENTPKMWNEMASVSGKNDDLTGFVNFSAAATAGNLPAEITLEEISFSKMKNVTNSALESAGTAVNIALGLIGIMALWLGVMKVAEEAGLIKIIARAVRPVTKFLFPDVPVDHPAMGSMIMNISANMLGLGNAATPFGLKAMEELDKLNPNKGTATNAMVTFLAVNTAGLTLIPATAIAIRAAAGSSDPAIIIGTAIFGAFCATTVGITATKVMEKFPVQKGDFSNWMKSNVKGLGIFFLILVLAMVFALTGVLTALFSALNFINPDLFKGIIQVISILAIPTLIFVFIGYGALKKVKIYEVFVEGAKEGFDVAIRIIPYLVAMLVAIGIFRAGGAMEVLITVMTPLTDFIGMPAEALPMALMRPLSGSGSLGIMAEIINTHGADSFIGILVSTFFGSTETTFYVLAVYFGSVNIRNTRHALPAGLLADIAGILGAVFIVRLLFG